MAGIFDSAVWSRDSGFALGPEYRLHNDFLGGNNFFSGAQFSTKLYQKYYTGWAMPRLAGGTLLSTSTECTGTIRRSITLARDPDLRKTDRTDYRLEDTTVDASLGVRTGQAFAIWGLSRIRLDEYWSRHIR